MQAGLPLAQRRALVTGGAKGIGAAIAWRFAAEGADVAIVGRNRTSLEKTADAIRDLGCECLTIESDLGSQEGATYAAECALAHAAAWDILVNNAVATVSAPLLDMTASGWDACMGLNVRAPMLLARALVPQMIARGGGKIVNIASMGAFIGTPNAGAYTASEAALCQLTRTMAVEWAAYNVQTNAICREADDVVSLALFLSGPHSNDINGVVLPLDGGLLVAP